MELYIGGYKQGKLKYVRDKYPDADDRILNDFHLWIKKLMKDGENASEKALEYIKSNPECIIICDEIGNGIVPMDEFERKYREELGRILCDVADKADSVERIICGIGQKIK